MKKEKRYYSTPNYWDDFLKPTGKKTIISIALFLIFIPVVYYDNGVRCVTTPCNSQDLGSVFFFLFSNNKIAYGISFFDLIIGLAISYLAACFVVYFWEKRKKK